MNLNAKYRPKTFDEVVGQNVTVTILNKMLDTGNIKNCMAFVGASGCGKTTVARLIANKINGGVGHPVEIDAASNNGVDQVRSIIESANQRAIDSKYKVYIIDEAHMLTTAAWNAFLKTIEEPPTFTIFIFCTTEPNKIPNTIMNRVQRYNFSKISNEQIFSRLCYICAQEGFTNFETACDFITKASGGSMRSAITHLEQCACLSTDISLDNAKQLLGELSYERMVRLTGFLLDKNEGNILIALDMMHMEGLDLKTFIDHYLSFVLDCTKYLIFNTLEITNIPIYLEHIEDPSLNIKGYTTIENGVAWFNSLSSLLLELKAALKAETACKEIIGAYLIKFCRGV